MSILRFPILAALLLAVLLLPAGSPAPAAPGNPDDILGEQPLASAGDDATASRRVIVTLRVDITAEILAELSDYGSIHGWIDRYRLVALTPKRRARLSLRALPYVESVERDHPRLLTAVGMWDRDMLDVTDVEETGVVGDPDAREVAGTGAGVHVAVIDSGLIENWRDFLPESRVAVLLARAFMGGGAVGQNFVPANEFHVSNPTNLWERDTSSHGTAVASHVIGFNAGARFVDGTAPGATIIPLKVFPNGEAATWASRIIAAIAYTTGLVEDGTLGRTVINLSLSGSSPNRAEERAINDAIAAGIIVVCAGTNRGENGMGWPGAFPQVISVGAVGWTRQWQPGTAAAPNRAFWWTQDVGFDPDRGGRAQEASEAFVTGFSGRAMPSRGQELDVLAPGALTVAPGAHGPLSGLFFWSGTSFSTPLTAGVAALILERNPVLAQAEVEAILKSTAQPMAADDSREGVLVPAAGGEVTISWDTDCAGVFCDPVGAGLVQADAAVDAADPGNGGGS